MNQSTPASLDVSVVVVTWRRPESVRRCLEHIDRLLSRPRQIIVVDASEDTQTAAVAASFSHVEYVPFPPGAGHTPRSRNCGLLHVRSSVVAFLDDDAYVRPTWLSSVAGAFDDPCVAAVAGRTCNGRIGEEAIGVDRIGKLNMDGELTGNFAADPRRIIRVEHGIGANMAFRASALGRLGGFREDFGGTAAVREETDMFFRVRALGLAVVFVPDAVVDHVGAPHPRGRRFGLRYYFWGYHNHMLLLARNLGLGSPYFKTWLTRALKREIRHLSSRERGVAIRAAAALAGMCCGGVTVLIKARWTPRDPARVGRTAELIRVRLETPPAASSPS